MPELQTTLPASRDVILWTDLLLSIMLALIAMIAWQGFARLRENALRDAALSFGLVGLIQMARLAAQSMGLVIPAPLWRAIDCALLAVISWPFLGSTRLMFLIGSLAVCGIVGAYTLSWWQLTGAELDWAAPLWWLIGLIVLGVATISLWIQRGELPGMLIVAWAVLTSAYAIGAAGQLQAALLVRLVGLLLILAALMQFPAREMDNVQAELVSFSEHSLRQTQQLLTLLRASTTLVGRPDVSTILNEAVEGVALGVGADTAFAALMDDSKGRVLRVQAVYPPRPGLLGKTVALTAQPALAHAISLEHQVILPPTRPGVQALAALMGSAAGPSIVQPLASKGRALGVIVALNGRHRREFTEDEQRMMEAFGGQVASAVENALLDRLLEAQTRELAESLAAREEEASRRAAILESIADGVVVFDHDEMAIASNPAASAILGLGSGELVGRAMNVIMDGRIHPDDYDLVRELMEGNRPRSAFKIRWDNRTILLSVAPVKLPSTSRHGMVMVLHDVTEEARTERLKSEFVSVVSHELRSPLAMLDSSMQVIQRYGLDHLLPEQRVQWYQLVQEFKLAKTTINNLVGFAAFLSKQGQLQLSALDVSKLACDAAAELEPMAQARDVTMTLELPPEPPPVYGDRERLTEAIYHLIHNAIKFNRPGGAVLVSCRLTPGRMVVEVADTGVGIPPERLPDIWSDFSQLADPLRRGVEGLGLGLALVRYVVEAHGGEVWAESTPGQGSLFGFGLPLAR